MTDTDWWGVAEAASHCGMTEGDWRTRVSRGTAPAPDDPDDDSRRPKYRRSPRWKAETVRAWHAGRNRKRGRPRRADRATPDHPGSTAHS